MKVIESSRSVFFDVDNTLVFSLRERPHEVTNEITKIKGRKFWVHIPHREIIKDFKARGHTVIVWSQGGWEWAKSVVEALQLEEYVDVIMSKPDWYFDDKGSGDWLGEDRRFYKDRNEGGM